MLQSVVGATREKAGSTVERLRHFRTQWRRASLGDVVGNLFGHQQRRVWESPQRLHLELRSMDDERLERFAIELQDELSRHPSLQGVLVNGETLRVVVHCNAARGGCAEVVLAAMERVERRLGLEDRPFADASADHPSDAEPMARRLVDVAADMVGIGLGTTLQLVGHRGGRVGRDVATAVSVAKNTPRWRGAIEGWLGAPAVEVGLSVSSTMLNAFTKGPVSPLIDLGHQLIALRGTLARHDAWVRREEELYQDRQGVVPRSCEQERPLPLPQGPIGSYSDHALLTSLGGFLVGVADTHELERAASPLLSGLPKAARYGASAFCAELTRVLADRGTVVLRAEALERLDRIDSVIIDGRLLQGEGLLLGGVHPVKDEATWKDEERAERLRQRSGKLLDPQDTTAEASDEEGWRLAPMDETTRERADVQEVVGRARLEEAAELQDPPLLILWEGETPAAVVETEPTAAPQTVGLLRAARRSNLLLVVRRRRGQKLPSFYHPDVIIEEEADLREVIRQFQREGRVVMLVGQGPPEALRAADVAVGLVRPGEPVPWAADLLAGHDLDDARFVVDACRASREMAEQSVTLAGVGAAVGAFLSLGGLKRTEPSHVMTAVNAASIVALANGIRRAVALSHLPAPPAQDPTPWHSLEAEEVLERVGSEPQGLSEGEAASRLRPPPPIPSRPRRMLRAGAKELANPFTPVLAAGAVLSAVVGSLVDAAMVASVVALNGAIGGYERYRAEAAIEDLEQREQECVLVRRDGTQRLLRVEKLVVGDVVILRAGEVVPADCRVLSVGDGVEVDESALTGESLPVRKTATPSWAAAVADRRSMVYANTSIASGTLEAVVVATGRATEARRGAALIDDASGGDAGVEARLRELADLTVPTASAAGALLVGGGLMRGQDIRLLADAGVGMAVAAVPEGLPLLATISQLAAARRLSRRGALVRNPRALEALGRVDIICADKTGTLTEGRIRLRGIDDGSNHVELSGEAEVELDTGSRALLAAALRGSPQPNEHHELAHQTDRAVVHGIERLSIEEGFGLESWSRSEELPFTSERGYYAALGADAQGPLLALKGAPEVILERCQLDDEAHGRLTQRSEKLAGQGLRVLAVAQGRPGEGRLHEEAVQKLEFLGFVTLHDPPRQASSTAIERIRGAGIEVMMITGDHPETARQIARELGLIGEDAPASAVITGPELAEFGPDELAGRLGELRVIARAAPADKVRIVRALQQQGRTVAMTGDGANDASAIRLADVGIALGERATAAARDAADLVVADERIETIVDAIAEGRAMWSSVRDAIAILTGGNLGEIGFTVLASLFDRPPFNARQLLLVNLLTDVAPALAITLRPPEEDQLEQLLGGAAEETLGEELDEAIRARALTTTAGAAVAYIWARLMPFGRRSSPTVALLSLIGTQLGQTLVIGRATREVWAAGLGSAAFLLAVVETPGLSHFFGCRPLGPLGLGIALSSSTTVTFGALAVDRLAPAIRRWRDESLRQRPIPFLRGGRHTAPPTPPPERPGRSGNKAGGQVAAAE